MAAVLLRHPVRLPRPLAERAILTGPQHASCGPELHDEESKPKPALRESQGSARGLKTTERLKAVYLRWVWILEDPERVQRVEWVRSE